MAQPALRITLEPFRSPHTRRDLGKVLTDLAITLALGGDACCHVALLRAEPGVHSDPTISSTITAPARDTTPSIHLAATLGTDLSHETISEATAAVAEEVTAWQTPAGGVLRSHLPRRTVVKVRDSAYVTHGAAHIAVGVDMDGVKHVLGMCVQASKGAKFLDGGVCRAGQLRHQERADRVPRRAQALLAE